MAAPYQQTNTMDEEGLTLVTPHAQKPRRWVWTGLAGALMMGAAVAVAWPRPQNHSPMDRLAAVRNGLLRAFSTRALQDGLGLGATASFLFNEVDAEVPSTTGVKFVLQKSEAGEEAGEAEEAPVLKVIFFSKEGKGKELAEQFDGAFKKYCHVQREQYGPEMESSLREMVSFEQLGDADEALITVKFYPGPPDEVEEQVKSTNTPSPKFEGELFIGRSIKEMFEQRATVPLPLLPKGIHAKAHVQFASALLQVASEFAPHAMNTPVMPLLSGLASMSVSHEIFYQSEKDLGDKWESLRADVPWNLMIQSFQELPQVVRDQLKGFDGLADGIKSVALSHWLHDWEFLATFTNFKIAEVAKAVLDAKPPQGNPMMDWLHSQDGVVVDDDDDDDDGFHGGDYDDDDDDDDAGIEKDRA